MCKLSLQSEKHNQMLEIYAVVMCLTYPHKNLDNGCQVIETYRTAEACTQHLPPDQPASIERLDANTVGTNPKKTFYCAVKSVPTWQRIN